MFGTSENVWPCPISVPTPHMQGFLEGIAYAWICEPAFLWTISLLAVSHLWYVLVQNMGFLVLLVSGDGFLHISTCWTNSL